MTTPLIKIIPDFSTTLASKVAIGATSASLSTATDINGDTLATGKYGFTIDRKNSSKEYFTATLTGTSLTNVATIDITDGSETAGLLKEHRKGAEIIISDFVALKRIQDVLETGYVDTYVPTTDYQIATKAYADGLTVGGAPNADATTKGIAEVATTAEINSGASVGSTGASLIVTPNALKTSTYTTRLDALEAVVAPIRRVYTSSGTWTKPAGLKYIEVEVCGGGGGGAYDSGSRVYGSCSGGGGGYSKKLISTSTLGTTEAYIIGNGGNGGTNSPYVTIGQAGGTTSFGSHLQATGGGGGTSNHHIGGSGGVGSNGDLNLYGGYGEGVVSETGSSSTSYYSGSGGSSFFCPITPKTENCGGATPRYDAISYGGGGSGSSTVVGDRAGNGAAGVIILTEYY